jgi:hypothetical protein
MRLISIFSLLLLLGLVLAQDEPAPAEEGAEDGKEKKEECEEAWEYLEFLKAEIK